MVRLSTLVMTLVISFLSLTAIAAIDAYSFPDEGMRKRYNSLIDELRCPQCLKHKPCRFRFDD